MLLRSLPRARGPGVSTTPCTHKKPCVRSSPPSSQILIRSFRTSTARPASVASTWASTRPGQNGQNGQNSPTSPNPYTPQQKPRIAHAIPNPSLAGIEKRWEHMPPQEQAVLWMQLRDRMVVDWHELTFQEKKIAWWVAFGPHGPRAEDEPGHWRKVFTLTGVGVGAGIVLFWIIHQFARPPPRTMTKEWQEATNEYLKKQNANPIYGLSSEGYTGKGHVQSGPAKKSS